MRHHSIELLESRIAPASLVPGGQGVTFLDSDGDLVTAKTTKGTFTIGGNITFVNAGVGEQIFFLSPDASFTGANITVSVKKMPGGDGRTAVTGLDASGVDLGAVSIAGDLESLTVGSGSATVPALKSLKLASFGVTQKLLGVQASKVTGPFGKITIDGNLQGEKLEFVGKGGSVFIGGSVLENGAGASAGSLAVDGSLASLTIKGDIRGSAAWAGGVFVGAVKSVKIGGDIEGGTQVTSGRVFVDKAATITVGGEIIGNAQLFSEWFKQNVTIGGIDGGSIGLGQVSRLVIKGDVVKSTPTPSSAATIGAITIGTLQVDGDIRGQLVTAGDSQVIEARRIGTFKVKGDIDGGTGTKMTISVDGNTDGTKAKLTGSTTIGGSVRNVFFNLANDPVFGPNGTLAVGKITVGKDWTSSSLSASTTLGPTAPATAPVKGKAGVVLDGLTIKGALRLNGANTLSYLAADDVKFVSIGGKKAALTPGQDETLTINDGMITDLMVIYKVA